MVLKRNHQLYNKKPKHYREGFCTTISPASPLDVKQRSKYAFDLLIEYLQVHYRLLQLIADDKITSDDYTTITENYHVLIAGLYVGKLIIITQRLLKRNIITIHFMEVASKRRK